MTEPPGVFQAWLLRHPGEDVRRFARRVAAASAALEGGDTLGYEGEALWVDGHWAATAWTATHSGTPLPLDHLLVWRAGKDRQASAWVIADIASGQASLGPAGPVDGPPARLLPENGLAAGAAWLAQQASVLSWREGWPPSPPWVHALLANDTTLLHAELTAVWGDWQPSPALWEHLESLRACGDRLHEWTVVAGVKYSPVRARAYPQPALEMMTQLLSHHKGAPARLARLYEASGLFGRFRKALTVGLRNGLAPAPFWQLWHRRRFSFFSFCADWAGDHTGDFVRLPPKAAHKALDAAWAIHKSSRNALPAVPLENLAVFLNHAPAWPHWRAVLEALSLTHALPAPAQAHLAGLREAQLSSALPPPSTPPGRPRF